MPVNPHPPSTNEIGEREYRAVLDDIFNSAQMRRQFIRRVLMPTPDPRPDLRPEIGPGEEE